MLFLQFIETLPPILIAELIQSVQSPTSCLTSPANEWLNSLTCSGDSIGIPLYIHHISWHTAKVDDITGAVCPVSCHKRSTWRVPWIVWRRSLKQLHVTGIGVPRTQSHSHSEKRRIRIVDIWVNGTSDTDSSGVLESLAIVGGVCSWPYLCYLSNPTRQYSVR